MPDPAQDYVKCDYLDSTELLLVIVPASCALVHMGQSVG